MTLEVLIAIMVVLMFGSAFFSSSETSLFSLSRPTLKRWRESGKGMERVTARLMDDQHATLSAILLGNNFVNLLSALILLRIINKSVHLTNAVTWLAANLRLDQELAVELVSVLINTCILLLFGELTPKAIAYSMPNRLAPKIAGPISMLKTVTYPFIFLLKKASNMVLSMIGGQTKSHAISAEEYRTFTRLEHKVGVFEAAEVDLFEKVFRLREVRVGQIMTPRPDIIYADASCGLSELEDRLRSSKHTMIPIVNEDLDHVKGILDVKRFILLDYDEREEWLDTCLDKPVYLPENAHADLAMEQFRQNGTRMAMVVNEFGGIEGIITVEDLLEEVVGEIYDEFDKPHWSINTIGDDEWRLSGLTPLEELGRRFSFDFGESEADTVAGYLSERLDRVPEKGDVLTEGVWRFRVRRTHKHRIIEIDLRKHKGGDAS